MNSLAIDTSTEVLGLCVRKGDAFASLSLRHGLQHAPSLLPLIDRLLREVSLAVAEINLIICSTGPGSFTGIRIGLATAKGISLATSCPVAGVSTLDAFAYPYGSFAGDVYPVIDARKGNYYTALFQDGSRASEYLDIPPGELRRRLLAGGRGLLVGPDAGAIRDRLFEEGDRKAREKVSCSGFIDPRALLQIGEERFAREGAVSESLIPLYLRKSEAEISAGRKH